MDIIIDKTYLASITNNNIISPISCQFLILMLNNFLYLCSLSLLICWSDKIFSRCIIILKKTNYKTFYPISLPYIKPNSNNVYIYLLCLLNWDVLNYNHRWGGGGSKIPPPLQDHTNGHSQEFCQFSPCKAISPFYLSIFTLIFFLLKLCH